ncbi:MAG: glycosyltransferase family 4 protein, partial [Sulfitobacter sp.]|nr:glycosyltransferase family 4 protein [Sulfitobacter sp.]
YAPPGQKLCHLKPFLRRTEATYRAQTGRGIISVGMMRARDKLPSYQLIAATLHHLSTGDWNLSIVGDGPERGAVETLMQPFGGKVRFLGALDEADLCNAYRSAAIFLWPGVNEAIGMTYLEAQAESLAVVAQDRPGLRDVLPQGHHPTPEEGSAALARRLDDLLQDPQLLETEGRAAYDNLVQHHLLPQAADTLKSGLAELGVTA